MSISLCPACPGDELASVVWMRCTEPEVINSDETLKCYGNGIGCNCCRARAEKSLYYRRTVTRIIRGLHLLAQRGCRMPRVELTREIEKSPSCHLGWIVKRSVGGDFFRSKHRDTNAAVPRVAVQGQHRQWFGANMRRKLA